jgi:hypothetical protein
MALHRRRASAISTYFRDADGNLLELMASDRSAVW